MRERAKQGFEFIFPSIHKKKSININEKDIKGFSRHINRRKIKARIPVYISRYT